MRRISEWTWAIVIEVGKKEANFAEIDKHQCADKT